MRRNRWQGDWQVGRGKSEDRLTVECRRNGGTFHSSKCPEVPLEALAVVSLAGKFSW